MVIVKYINLNKMPSNFNGLTYSTDLKIFFKNKCQHRYYGPAIIWSDYEKEWWINNKFYGNFNHNYNQKKNFVRI